MTLSRLSSTVCRMRAPSQFKPQDSTAIFIVEVKKKRSVIVKQSFHFLPMKGCMNIADLSLSPI